ncbi:hypothetical protein JHK87_032982 [Glycine soja]|nr:hypothetical protein JHK87_032982 [Glycine soja]
MESIEEEQEEVAINASNETILNVVNEATYVFRESDDVSGEEDNGVEDENEDVFEDDGARNSATDSVLVDSNFVIILTTLLCALIYILGLIVVARCDYLHYLHLSSSNATPRPLPIKASRRRSFTPSPSSLPPPKLVSSSPTVRFASSS